MFRNRHGATLKLLVLVSTNSWWKYLTVSWKFKNLPQDETRRLITVTWWELLQGESSMNSSTFNDPCPFMCVQGSLAWSHYKLESGSASGLGVNWFHLKTSDFVLRITQRETSSLFLFLERRVVFQMSHELLRWKQEKSAWKSLKQPSKT